MGTVPTPAWVNRRLKTQLAESKPADARQPDAVGHIGVALLVLLDVLGVNQERRNAGGFEGCLDVLPVEPGRLHRRRRWTDGRATVRRAP